MPRRPFRDASVARQREAVAPPCRYLAAGAWRLTPRSWFLDAAADAERVAAANPPGPLPRPGRRLPMRARASRPCVDRAPRSGHTARTTDRRPSVLTRGTCAPRRSTRLVPFAYGQLVP